MTTAETFGELGSPALGRPNLRLIEGGRDQDFHPELSLEEEGLVRDMLTDIVRGKLADMAKAASRGPLASPGVNAQAMNEAQNARLLDWKAHNRRILPADQDRHMLVEAFWAPEGSNEHGVIEIRSDDVRVNEEEQEEPVLGPEDGILRTLLGREAMHKTCRIDA